MAIRAEQGGCQIPALGFANPSRARGMPNPGARIWQSEPNKGDGSDLPIRAEQGGCQIPAARIWQSEPNKGDGSDLAIRAEQGGCQSGGSDLAIRA
ncbi:hypothetical protein QUF72_04065 [Desulfobacterales bacterium HSG2]|nr:hypothetical protein [Desulfobacterales bacterium HSG2]